MVLYPVIRLLRDKHVVLASASPRRQEILSNAGLRVEVIPSRFKENLRKDLFPTPYAYAMETAKQKALEVARRLYQKDLRTPDIIIGADTIVAVGGLILGKPMDKQDAYNMLSRLNAEEHSVFTGVAIVHCSREGGHLDTDVLEFYEETRVKFSQLSEELLWEYIHSGEPMDKAGGYGIQALGGMLVEYIHGDFLNVVGFPLNCFCKKLAELYCPPRREDLQRVKHDSIPTVDTFEHLSDLEDGGSRQGGAQEDPDRPQAQGRKDTKDTDRKPTLESRPPAGLMELIDGFKASKALFTACKMKVFDLLRDEGPLSDLDVARKLDASERGIALLLEVCAALALLDKTERGYSNTDLADRYLLSDGEHSLHSLITLNSDSTWAFFSHLELAIREGAREHQRALGTTGEHASQDGHYQNADRTWKKDFARAVHSLTDLAARQVATAFDLSRFSSACDLGGCMDTLAHELARQYPGLKVTVLDLPDIIEDAMCSQRHGAQTGQVSFVPGDFFSDTLPEADLYVVSRVLHTWPDDKVHQLLNQISSACKPGGGLLLVEVLRDDAARRTAGSLLQSLTVLLRAEGRQRSPSEFRHLLQAHGFADVQAMRAGSVLDVIMATRA